MKRLIALVFIITVFAGFHATGQITEYTLKFGEVLNKISRYYVDTVNEEELVEGVIVDMLHELDPHSAYLSEEQVKASQEQLEGGFEGIGVSFNILNDTIFIINPISGGPSEKVGIRAGDRIIKVNGEKVAGTGITNIDVQKLLKGEKGTKVDVTILRRRADKLLEFTITRDEIPIYSLDAAYMVDKNTGYIKLARFSNTTMDEFLEALRELEKQNMENLILDLSGNGGGYLFAAVNLADQFLSGRRMIVYTEGMQNPKRDFYSTERGSFQEGKLVVMIDETSASASEIVAGAVQDWDRAVIVGRRSFGKGLVQGRFELRDGSELRLTVAKYYTPTGRLIQKPYEEGFEAYSKDILNRYSSGELVDAENIDFPDSLIYRTMEKKRPVYGGGGIMPDYYVPIDTSYYSDYYRNLISRGILNQFVLEYVDDNRKKLNNNYQDFQSFKSEFTIDKEIINDLIEYAEEEGLEYKHQEFEISKDQLKMLCKAYIARDLWNTAEFYQIYNQDDPIYQKSQEIINSEELYRKKLQAYKGEY